MTGDAVSEASPRFDCFPGLYISTNIEGFHYVKQSIANTATQMSKIDDSAYHVDAHEGNYTALCIVRPEDAKTAHDNFETNALLKASGEHLSMQTPKGEGLTKWLESLIENSIGSAE